MKVEMVATYRWRTANVLIEISHCDKWRKEESNCSAKTKGYIVGVSLTERCEGKGTVQKEEKSLGGKVVLLAASVCVL